MSAAVDSAAVDRAHDLLTLLGGIAESVHPLTLSVSLLRTSPRPLIRIVVATDEALDAVAADRALTEREIGGRDGGWWVERSGQWDRLRIVARGPWHPGAMPAPDAAPGQPPSTDPAAAKPITVDVDNALIRVYAAAVRDTAAAAGFGELDARAAVDLVERLVASAEAIAAAFARIAGVRYSVQVCR